MSHQTIIDPRHLGHLHEALQKLGATFSSAEATWVHTHGAPPVPVDYRAVSALHQVTIKVERSGVPRDAERLADVVVVVVNGPDDARECAYMQNLLTRFSLQLRLECRGVSQFLGREPDAVSWHEIVLPQIMLWRIHTFIEDFSSDWEVLKQAYPTRFQESENVRVVESASQKVQGMRHVRWYLRQEDIWLVLELQPSTMGVTVRFAASGASEQWINDLLGRLEALREELVLESQIITPSGRRLKLDRKYTWDDLYIDENLKLELRRELVDFFSQGELYQKMQLPFRRGVLLHGPPGTGKTLVGRILASTLEDCAFIWVTAKDVKGAESIAALFDLARLCRRAVLFLEDLDFYASHRSQASSSGLGELLVQLDGPQRSDGLLVVATTNELSMVELALKDRPSRFDRVFEISSASTSVRQAHLLKLLSPFGVTEPQLQGLIDRTKGFTGAQLQELALRARMSAAGQGRSRITAEDLSLGLKGAQSYRATPGDMGLHRAYDGAVGPSEDLLVSIHRNHWG